MIRTEPSSSRLRRGRKVQLSQALRSRDVAAVGYIAAWKIVGLLPPRWVRRLAEFAASRVTPPKQLRTNLRRVTGADPSPTLLDASLRSYARYWAEAFCLPRMASRAALRAQLDASVIGVSYLDSSLAKGKGVVLTLPHSGNWDMAGVWLVHHAGSFTTVAERLRPEVLFDAFVEYRNKLGFEVLAHRGGPAPFEHLATVLRGGGVVCLMGERDLKGKGVPVTFFGEPTTFPAGPAELARVTGAALHTVDCHFTDGGWEMEISEPLVVDDLVATTQRIADRFARTIAEHPADWHMLQPVWPADRRRD